MIIIQMIAVPILIILYAATLPCLLLRNLFQYLCVFLDWLFDCLGWLAGWDTRCWPMPRAQDSPLPNHSESMSL